MRSTGSNSTEGPPVRNFPSTSTDDVMPIGVIAVPGTGVQDNLAQTEKKAAFRSRDPEPGERRHHP